MSSMKKCSCCEIELNKHNVRHIGFFGWIEKILFPNGWKEFRICFECRSLFSAGYSAEELLKTRNKSYIKTLKDIQELKIKDE